MCWTFPCSQKVPTRLSQLVMSMGEGKEVSLENKNLITQYQDSLRRKIRAFLRAFFNWQITLQCLKILFGSLTHPPNSIVELGYHNFSRNADIDYCKVHHLKRLCEKNSIRPEIPGSLVSEPKHRDSRSKTRISLGIGLEISRTLEPESESESNFLVFWNRNRYRNQILRSEVPESEPELYFR